MNRTEYTFLLAEKNSLIQLIEETPEIAVITRGSFQERLEEVESLLEKHSMSKPPVEGRISFRGKPVLGTQGIESTFATRIMSNFSELIAAKASSYLGPLSSTGKISQRDVYRMNITGTTVGSFGFVFSECSQDQPVTDELRSPVESALIDSIEFFNAIQRDDDEDIANVVDQTDDRVLLLMRKFLNELLVSEAVCAVESGLHSFHFNSVSEIDRSMKKIEPDNIREWEESVTGIFIGVLVSERKFDFRIKNKKMPALKGKIPNDINDLEEIGRNLYKKNFRIYLRVKQIGTGPLRYTLLRFEPIS